MHIVPSDLLLTLCEQKEKKLFLERLKEVGANGQWGIFSQAIPGRVGYQCSNFYRLLIERGELTDPNYVLDAKGKACYVKGRGRARHLVEGNDNASTKKGKKSNKKTARRKRKNSDNDASDVNDDDDADSDVKVKKRGKQDGMNNNAYDIGMLIISEEQTEEEKQKALNPLPNMIDPITLEPVVRPAISPQGVVMGYDTWLQCLRQEPRNRCPITKATVHKRELVLLTWDNIEQYRALIKS